MGIIAWPAHKPLAATVPCVICGRTTSLQDATAGMLDARNNQTFACNGHFWDEHQFIVGWAEFCAEQRYGM